MDWLRSHSIRVLAMICAASATDWLTSSAATATSRALPTPATNFMSGNSSRKAASSCLASSSRWASVSWAGTTASEP